MTKRSWILCVAALLFGAVPAAQGQEPPAKRASQPAGRTNYFRDIVLEKGETANVLTCVFCSITVRGEVKGDAVAVWGNIEIDGKLEGNAVAAGGKITLRGEGTVEGDLIAVGGRVERKGSGIIHADVSEVPYFYFPGQRSMVLPGTLIFIGANVLFSMLYIVAGRARVESLAGIAHQRGLIVFLVGFVVMAALFGLFAWAGDIGKYEDEAALAVWIVIMLLVLPGISGVSLTVGRWLRSTAGMAAGMLIGAVVLSLLALVPLAGLLVFLIAWVFALGATLVGKFGFARTKSVAAEAISGS